MVRMPATLSVERRQLVIFLIVAFALPWAAWLGYQFSDINLVAPLGMLSVGIAVLVALWLTGSVREGLTETGVIPVRPWAVLMRHSLLGFGLVLGAALAAISVGALAGTSPLDLTGFSALHAAHGGGSEGSTLALLGRAFVTSMLLLLLVLPLAFCEEWGWRGLLLARLRRLGTLPAIVLSGLIWALWHLPGYVGTGARDGFLPFMIFAVVFGALLTWLRLRTGSIWPAAVAHAANNAVVTGFINVAFTDAAAIEAVDAWSFGLSGWPGWLIICLFLGTVVLVGWHRSAGSPTHTP